MWQYTTETIINSNIGNLAGGHRFDLLKDNGESVITYKADGSINTVGADGTMLLIDGVNSLKKSNITHIYRTVYMPAAKEVIEMDLDEIGASYPTSAGAVLRMTVEIKEDGRVSSNIQNAFLHKSRPFHFEVIGVNDTETDAANMVSVINNSLRDTDFHYFKASVVAGKNGDLTKIVLTADDCYIRFKTMELASVPATLTGSITAERLLGYQDYDVLANGVISVHGREGNGTVARLIKNMRIPTSARMNPFAPDFGGQPVPGGMYDQYLIEYETERRHVGHQVMGSCNDKSLTSHVLFIESNIAEDVNKILSALATIEEAGTNYTINLTSSDEDKGEVNVQIYNGSSWTNTDQRTFIYGTEVKLVASAESTYSFSSWSDTTDTTNPRTYIVTNDANIVATFA